MVGTENLFTGIGATLLRIRQMLDIRIYSRDARKPYLSTGSSPAIRRPSPRPPLFDKHQRKGDTETKQNQPTCEMSYYMGLPLVGLTP